MRILILLIVLFSFACGETTSVDLCKDIICVQGVCDPQDGQCSNPSSCEAVMVGAPVSSSQSGNQCIIGFECEDEECVPVQICDEDSPCDRGRCFDGACINFDSCSAPSDCLNDYSCEDGICAFDRCADVECEKGICDVQTGACVNEEVCTRENQDQNCIDAYYCYGQKCVEESEICEDLQCERGVCNAELSECVNDPACENDMSCLDNFFCAEEGCQENKCEDGMCARGVCEPQSGLCVNKESCQSVDECTDGFLCVENTCVEFEKACGDLGCPGNQVCDYNEANLSASCLENTRCERAIDCIGSRTCEDNVCGSALPCEADTLEPNDSLNEATRISSSEGNFRSASLCQGDVDFFVYDVNDSSVFSGTLVVNLQVEERHIGNGSLGLKVTAPTGEVKELSTLLPNANARIEFPIGALDRSDYIIEVFDDALQIGGAAYHVYAEVIEDSLSQSCLSATVLNKGDLINANTAMGTSFSLDSDCTSSPNTSPENIYEFTILDRSNVQIVVDPVGEADLSLSIRRVCENSSKDLTCLNRTAKSANESFNGFLEGGRYFLIVQGTSSNAGGAYSLSYSAEATICEFGEASCSDDNTSRFCSSEQIEYQTRTCDEGCDSGTGFCTNEAGDTCENPIDASQGYSGSVIFSALNDDYQVPSGACLPDLNAGTATTGPDAVYFVRLEAQKLLKATLTSDDFFENASLYLLSHCGDLGNSCLAGSSTEFTLREEISYRNETQSAIDLFIIADVEDSFDYGPTTIDIEVEDIICAPATGRCVLDNVETCNSEGTAYESLLCSAGCDAATGSCNAVPNDTCGGAITLTAPMTLIGRSGEFTNSYSPPSTCTGTTANGRDAVYSFSTSESGKVAQIRVDAQFDPALYVVEDCDQLGDTCVIGTDIRTGNTEEVEFLVNPNTTYYVVVDSRLSQNTSEFNLSFDLKTPSCTPGDLLGCVNGQELSFCSTLGVPRSYTCSGGCGNDACALPNGDTCLETIPATTGIYNGDFSGSDAIHFQDLDAGSCNPSSDKRGSDTIYEVTMNAGESLFANVSAGVDASVYLLDSCFDSDSCLLNEKARNPSLSYTATQSETVFLVVDRDSSFPSTTAFELDLRVGAPDCSPGAPSICDATGTKIQYCDPLGFSQTYDCTGTCTGGACDTPSGDECLDAIPIASGETKNGTLLDNTAQYTIRGPQEGACRMSQQSSSIGRDTSYTIDLNPGDLLEVDFQTTNTSALVYIVQDCSDLSTCVAINPQRGAGKISYLAESSGPVFIVVDSISSFSSTSYTLGATISGGVACVPNTPFCDVGNLAICNNSGSGVSGGFSCNGTCVDGSCPIDPAADICQSAPLINGIHVYDIFSNHTNDINPGSGCAGVSTGGADIAYQFELIPGEVFHARLESFGKETSSLYMIRDCLDPAGTCFEGDRNDFTTGISEIFYLPTQNETITLVADSSTTADDPFSLLIESIPIECDPVNTPLTCLSDDIQFCNSYGLLENFDCSGTCLNGVCQNPSGNACVDPIVISRSTSLINQTFEAPNEIEFQGLHGACDALSPTTGLEKIYALELDANETVEIDYNSQSSSTLMYLLGNCLDTQSCIDTTSTASRTGSLTYTATNAETIFLVVDRTSSSTTTLTFSLDVNFKRPCQQSDAPTCLDATTVEGCASDGFTLQTSCQGPCSNGSCMTPNGQLCEEAIVLQDGISLSRSFSGGDTFSTVGTHGLCSFPSESSGQDTIHSIDLLAGDKLTASYTSNDSTAMLYALNNCGDFSSCIGVDSGTSGTLVYTASVDETLFLVMDRTSETASRNYTLDVDIRRPNCTIGDAPTCSLPGEVSYCVDQVLQTASCIGCTNGACPTPTANSCADPIPASSGVLIQGTFAGENTLDLDGNVGGCNFPSSTPGVDHFYEISLLAGQTLTGTFASNSSLAILYVMSSCFDTLTCYDNSVVGNAGTISYTAVNDEDLIVVMDRTTSGNAPSFTYDLSLTVN